MRRGKGWWADVPPPAGRRPVVLLRRDSAYRVRAAVMVAPITRTIRNIPVEVPLDQGDGLPARAVANLDDMTIIPKGLLTQRIIVLSAEKIQAVEEALRFALDLA